MSLEPTFFLFSKATESSSSISRFSMAGITPTTFLPVFSSMKVNAGSSNLISPRNLLITIPFIRSRSSGSSNSIVPTIEAIAPPLSISAMRNTGACVILAIRIFTISLAFKLTSAGLPAPSMTIISKFSSRKARDSLTLSRAVKE